MPGPPPPPPPMAPPAMMPPPPAPFTPTQGGGPDDRSALLKSIRTGAKLKKTVTNDKSAPLIGINTSNNNSNNSGISGGGGHLSASSVPNGLNLGGLFAGGMPKLRATGKIGASNLSNSSNNINNNDSLNVRRKPDLSPQPVKNLSSVQNELKKQMASDNKNRGPPPPAPVRNVPDESTESKPHMSLKSSSSNGFRVNQSSLHSGVNQQLLQNSSTLHRKAKSNVNLSSLDTTDSVNGYAPPMRPVPNHGKPNLAPKPPSINGKPATPPKKLPIDGKPVTRAHSMRSPRPPSPKSPDAANNPAIKYGTVRNLSSIIGQSLGHSTGNLSPRPKLMLNGRPSAPPPSIPSHVAAPPPPPYGGGSPVQSPAPPPPSKTSLSIVRPPNHAPPPPPNSLPQTPSHAPPPPPHRTQPMRAPPAVPNSLSAPPPPPRHSSMRESATPQKNFIDFDERFKHMFHHSSMFPRPPPYKNVMKLYTTKHAGSKQQAPQPPILQSSSKTWDASSKAC